MAREGRKLAFGVEGRNVRVYTSPDRSSYIDLSQDEALEIFGAFASNLKRALGPEQAALPPTDKTAYKFRLQANQFATGTVGDGQPFVAFSFSNFPSVVVAVPAPALRQAAEDLLRLAEAPMDVKRQRVQ